MLKICDSVKLSLNSLEIRGLWFKQGFPQLATSTPALTAPLASASAEM